MADARNFVLLHGAWHGAWCWARVAARLRAQGHHVTTPTQTGLGERRHLLSWDISLETFVLDLVNHLDAEELTDVVLVGHSFGGIAITGAADRMPQRIRHLVYLDSRILHSGHSTGQDTPDLTAERRARCDANGGSPPPPPATFGLPPGADADWVTRRMTPHPFHTFETTLELRDAFGNGRPCSYIACTDPVMSAVAASQAWAREQPGWGYFELKTSHDAMVTAPDELAALLVRIAD